MRQRVHLLYRKDMRSMYARLAPELVDVYASKDSADEAARKKNSYTAAGRWYAYFVKTKKLK